MIREFVLKVSGHVFDSGDLVRRVVDAVRRLWGPGHRMAIVVGGGSVARRYIELARSMGASESMADAVGIMASRLNAQLVISALGDIAYRRVPTSLDEIYEAWSIGKVPVSGGLQPGQSTAAVAMLVAEHLGLENVIYCANVDAVYTSDPRRDPSARRLERVSASELYNILSSTGFRAGTYELIDQWAIRLIQRSGLKVYIVDCSRPELIMDVAVELRGYGTLVTP